MRTDLGEHAARSQTTEKPFNAIEVQGLTRVFGDLRAVDGIDLSIRRGELFSLLGPNGAGKTTTIKMLCCYYAEDRKYYNVCLCLS